MDAPTPSSTKNQPRVRILHEFLNWISTNTQTCNALTNKAITRIAGRYSNADKVKTKELLEFGRIYLFMRHETHIWCGFRAVERQTHQNHKWQKAIFSIEDRLQGKHELSPERSIKF